MKNFLQYVLLWCQQAQTYRINTVQNLYSSILYLISSRVYYCFELSIIVLSFVTINKNYIDVQIYIYIKIESGIWRVIHNVYTKLSSSVVFVVQYEPYQITQFTIVSANRSVNRVEFDHMITCSRALIITLWDVLHLVSFRLSRRWI
jgi:AAA15 family ATPase/GTPase